MHNHRVEILPEYLCDAVKIASVALDQELKDLVEVLLRLPRAKRNILVLPDWIAYSLYQHLVVSEINKRNSVELFSPLRFLSQARGFRFS